MERERMPDATLEKLEQYFPGEVRDVREASEARSIAEAERQLSTRFFMQPSLGRRVLSSTEEAAMGHVAQGRGWLVDASRTDPQAEAQARREQNERVFGEEAAAWKARR